MDTEQSETRPERLAESVPSLPRHLRPGPYAEAARLAGHEGSFRPDRAAVVSQAAGSVGGVALEAVQVAQVATVPSAQM